MMNITRSASNSSSGSSTNYEKYLNLATESNPSMILELDLLGNIRYISPIWEQIIGTKLPEVGSSMSDIIIGSETDKGVFNEVIKIWADNDSVSYTVTFGLHGKYSEVVTMEACGVLIHDSITNKATHSMWIMKPIDEQLKDDYLRTSSRLPEEFIKILGFGSHIFLDYLNFVQSQLCLDESNLPTPNLELCRVCETFVPDWWLESHSKSCVCEHRIQSLIQLLQENLVEHCNYLYSITKENDSNEDSDNDSTISNYFNFEYKGYASKISPATIANLIDLCELAMAANISQIQKPSDNTRIHTNTAFRAIEGSQQMDKFDFSPNTQTIIQEVTNWRPPYIDEPDQGLTLLVEHTTKISKDKIDALLRLDNAMTFSYRLKNEVNNYVFQLIIEQIENNRLFLTHSMGSPIIRQNLTAKENSIDSDIQSNIPSSSQQTLTHGDSIDNIQQNNTSIANIASPQSQRPQTGTLFADAYLNEDVIPNSEVQQDDSLLGNKEGSKTQWSSKIDGFHSRSITPKQTIESAEKIENNSSMSMTDGLKISIFNNIMDPNTPKLRSDSYINLQNTGNPTSRHKIAVPNSFVLPKMKTSIVVTPRKGSPLLTSSSSASNINSLNQISRSSSTTKNIIDKCRSPISSPRVSINNLMTPDQVVNMNSVLKQPLSPLLLATNPVKNLNPNIKNYDVIKPISKGAYGNVYLGRKKLTGDYVAIKVLRKSDMIAKNQVTNVKSERAIMIVQSEKPYVVNLFESFQNKDNLFLVMEYLPGGDLATVIKMMGYLPDNWVKQYICEIVIGVADMHENGIIHHDLKPENLLIDKKGHLKLTDFGLSRAGLVHRHQNRPQLGNRLSISSSHSNSSKNNNNYDDMNNANIILDGIIRDRDRRHSNSSSISNIEPLMLNKNDSSGSFPFDDFTSTTANNNSASHKKQYCSLHSENQESTTLSDYALYHPNDSKNKANFFGTPDYLAPETIRGIFEGNQCDWWSAGCILFEMYFGYPPFHGKDIQSVFENILLDDIHWPNFSSPEEERECISPEAKDLITKFLIKDPLKRMGTGGISEIQEHSYFNDVNWDGVYEEEASFIPNVEHPEDTDYFELRGAVLEDLGEDLDDIVDTKIDDSNIEDSINISKVLSEGSQFKGTTSAVFERPNINTPVNKTNISTLFEADSRRFSDPSSPTVKSPLSGLSQHLRERRHSKLSDSKGDFGSFNYRNLVALDKANKDAINRLKSEHLMELQSSNRRTSTASIPSSSSDSSIVKVRQSRTSISNNSAKGHAHNSSTVSELSFRSISPERTTAIYGQKIPTTNKGTNPEVVEGQNLSSYSKNDDTNPLKLEMPSTPIQANKPYVLTHSPFTARSLSTSKTGSGKKNSEESSAEEVDKLQAISKIQSVRNRRKSARKNSSNVEQMLFKLDILLCEPIPIHRYYITKDLETLGCTVVSVAAGDELISRATSGIKFDLIITALKLPKLGAVDIVKLLKHTNGINSFTPVVAVTSYYHEATNANIFSDVFEKPITLDVLKKLVSKYALLKSQMEEDSILSDNEP
ncbi:hypothetical protein TPHA_0D00360 [Tetrapisispora phaffii CBS 4417]|uniref:non-specific serine/threonine protein kinase n=1 Tax=Tetrapisispora phaffii (strain ATCC 24235 / CBS 4417 / NBRC 1672 / NRRL Y-8282 / UCD 70-5) TaxID=1071381 RepID=G8BS59_TETPH|nr:hypothetical protein TPHA_0D00360 [Tetrapisispora phaffii CBS 4417]CCE62680.1 hypothetical protein TPHA_0D00360 [Tetrapisispora phaffii CBS 4417]